MYGGTRAIMKPRESENKTIYVHNYITSICPNSFIPFTMIYAHSNLNALVLRLAVSLSVSFSENKHSLIRRPAIFIECYYVASSNMTTLDECMQSVGSLSQAHLQHRYHQHSYPRHCCALQSRVTCSHRSFLLSELG